MRTPVTRREALQTAGAAGLAGLTAVAGCSAAPAGTDTVESTSSGTDTEESTPSGTDTEPATTEATTATTTDDGDSAIPETTSVGMGCYGDEQEYFFRPALLRVDPGTTVSFGVVTTCRQQTLAYHPDNDAPLRIPEGADPWSSPVLQGSEGGTYEVTFETPGVYDCFGLHEEFGQVGSVVVGTPDPEDEPGLAPPQASLPDPARESLADLNERTRAYLAEQDE